MSWLSVCGGGGEVEPLLILSEGKKIITFDKLIQQYSIMYFHLHINSKKWTFYRVKILKSKSFLIALHRNSKKWATSLLKNRPFLIALRIAKK